MRERPGRVNQSPQRALSGGGLQAAAVQELDLERALGDPPRELSPERSRASQHDQAAPVTFTAWRSGLIRTTSHTTPSFSSAAITQAEGSSSRRRRPWPAEVGKAWWLLCHASPSDGSASQRRLRDSS